MILDDLANDRKDGCHAWRKLCVSINGITDLVILVIISFESCICLENYKNQFDS